MYNENLAFLILMKLSDLFPRKVQLDDLRQSPSDFSSLPEEEWLLAAHALVKLGHAKAYVISSGMSDVAGVIANMEITKEGREFLDHARQASAQEVGDMDDLLPIFAKRQFEKDLTTYSATATPLAPISLLFIDLDHFKSVNDNFNHLVGDEVLVKVAQTLRNTCDKKGRCYRWGGEELAVILPNFSLTEAQAVAQRVREAISQTEFKSYPHRMTASIGISSFPETSSSSDLVKDADDATLEAKESGRDQVCSANLRTDRSSTPQISGPRLSAKEITKRVEAATVVVAVEHGMAAHFILEVLNDSDEAITLKEVQLLTKDDIRLTSPARQPEETLWQFPPRVKLPIAWRAQPDPAGALVKMNSYRGALFETDLKVLLTIEVLGRTKQCERKLWVRVDAFQAKIIQLAG